MQVDHLLTFVPSRVLDGSGVKRRGKTGKVIAFENENLPSHLSFLNNIPIWYIPAIK